MEGASAIGLQWTTWRLQPLGLGWNPGCAKGAWVVKRRDGVVGWRRCKAHIRAEVSSSEGTKKNCTWTPADPFAPSSGAYAGWDASESKVEGDYWAGLLQIGAGVALAVGFALVSHAAYAKRGGGGGGAPPVALPVVVVPEVEDEKDGRGNGSIDKEAAVEQQVEQLEKGKSQQKAAPAAQVNSGRIVIPAVVDQVQEQALVVLQALRVVETGVEAGGICTRREYARWLINASNVLARTSSRKLFPAMYIENVTELAFDDVSPQDPDFASIQGLAEAGLIASRLSMQDLDVDDGDGAPVLFAPDTPLSRQDLVSWKMALEGIADKVDQQSLQELSGFMDVHRIHKDAWPAIYADLQAGEDGIIASAFGFTKRFHPTKPTTKGQAAVALVLGEGSALVADESARLQADKIAEQAVQAELEMEARAFQEVDAALKQMLDLEKEGRIQAQAVAADLQVQLESLMSEKEQDKVSLLKEQAFIDSDKRVLAEYKLQLEQELQALATLRAEIAFERERAGKSRAEWEQERDALGKAKTDLEVEKQALALARQWAEEEARNARAHSKVLEEARNRWARQGIEVSVDDDLAEENIPEPTWRYLEPKAKAAVQEEPALAPTPTSAEVAVEGNFMEQTMTTTAQVLQDGRAKLLALVRNVVQTLQDVLTNLRAEASHKLQEVAQASENVRHVTISYVTREAQELQRGATSTVTRAANAVSESSRKVAYRFIEEAEKIAQKFKTT